MPFVNAYGLPHPSRFRRCIAAGADQLAIGSAMNVALAARIGPNGDCLWARIYKFGAATLELIDGIETADGHLLLATARTSGHVGSLVSFRISASGAVLSAQQLLDDGADGNARIYQVDEGPFLGTVVIAGPSKTAQYYQKRAGRSVYMGPNDEIVRATDFSLEGGGRLFGGVVDDTGYLFVGDAGEQRPLAQWLAAGDEAELDTIGDAALILNQQLDDEGDDQLQAWLLTAPAALPVKLSARAIAKRADGTFLVTGCHSMLGKRSTFVAEILRDGADLAVGRAMIVDCSGGHDRPVAIIATPAGARILERPSPGTAAPQVLHLTDDLDPAALTGFDLPAPFDLLDLAVTATDQVAISGSVEDRALLMSVDSAIACCKTVPLNPHPRQDLVARLQTAETSAGARPAGGAIKIVDEPVTPGVLWMCGGVDPWGDTTLVQSPYLNLQAAGSLGVDAAKGMLLRWFLLGYLGENHLPKGNLAGGFAPGGFNRAADDHVILRRAEWPAAPPVRVLDLATDRPIHVDDDERILVFSTGAAPRQGLFHIHFPDAAAFDTAKFAIDANSNPAGFIAAYGVRPIEIELRGVLAVACDLGFAPNPGCTVRLETLSVGENTPIAAKTVSGRHLLGAADGPVRRLLADNIRSIRVECTGTNLGRVAFVCYDDLLGELDQAHAWSEVGRFALTDQQGEAFARLEDSARFQVHNHWRRFNDGAFVNVANYHARWTDPHGLAQAVQTYVQRSDSDPRAIVPLQSTNYPEEGELSVSYVDMLGVASLDYHVARMFGLGYVDSHPNHPALPYLYLIEYRTEADLHDGKGARDVQHLYLCVPTRLADERLPMAASLDPVEYGLEVPTGSGGVQSLTDAQGYTPDGLSRYIRLHPVCAPLQAEEHGFFDPPDLFDLSREALPSCYGIEYRAQGAASWDTPEISHDSDYFDTASVAESMPSPFPATLHRAPFVHRETFNGIHEYAAYSINIFFRAAAPGNVQATDQSVFRPANRLLPPSDLQAQLIQEETPALLSTEAEQQALENLVALNIDSTLIRLCFNYGFTQDSAYGFADSIEIFFRPLMPRQVSGGVKAIVPDSDSARVRIEMESYTYPSTGELLTPILLPGDAPNFIGGALAAGTRRFVIEDILWPSGSVGADPIFVVRRPTTTGVVHTDGTGGNPGTDTLLVQDAPLNVAVGDMAMAIENMADAANWGTANPDPAPNPLAARVLIGDSSWQRRTESFVRDGVPVSRDLRGVWEQALVTEVQPKLYSLVFPTYVLTPHPQATAPAQVSWWRGVARVSVANRDPEDRRVLKVVQAGINGDGKFELLAQDDSGDPDPPLVSASSTVLVNYYPGYRIYLVADPGHGLSASTVLPATGQGSRLTVIAARSCDTLGTDNANQLYNYRSNLSVPAIVSAAEIVRPGVPGRPSGLLYAAPPDGEGIGSYSFTVGFQGRVPFALSFFRADALSILRALYKAETCAAITGWLFPPKPGSWFTDQFRDLLTFVESATMPLPSTFPAEGGGTIALPFPDHPALGLTQSTALATAKTAMQRALRAAFVGLTEQPLPYAMIATDRLPTNAPQVFRDRDGNLLKPDNPLFNLTPMARRLSDGSVQFVDFSLGGAMNANTVLFYCAGEIGNRMELGERSPIWGPVALVNLAAPLAPVVRRVTSVRADVALLAPPRIDFEVLPPSGTDPVAKLRMYRAFDPLSALSIRTMTMLPELAVADLNPADDGSFLVSDDFAAGDPPYGQSLFYRLVWVREVRYLDLAQQEQLADALSEPTSALFAKIVDTASPEAPVLSAALLPPDDQGAALLQLSWPGTVYNGTYHVSQLDGSGNWFRVGAVTSNDAIVTFTLPEALPPTTERGDPIYYRFMVTVESSGGRVSLYDLAITVNLSDLPN